MLNNSRMMWIVGSRATMLYYSQLRTAGAQVRKVLLQNAAEKWGVDAASLQHRAERRHQSRQRSAPDLRRDRGIRKDTLAAAGGRPKASSNRRRLAPDRQGRPAARHAGQGQRHGHYGIDVRMPGMVYATTLHSPVHNAAPESWNDADIKAMPGVIATVKLANGVAVVADRFERALAGATRSR